MQHTAAHLGLAVCVVIVCDGLAELGLHGVDIPACITVHSKTCCAHASSMASCILQPYDACKTGACSWSLHHVDLPHMPLSLS